MNLIGEQGFLCLQPASEVEYMGIKSSVLGKENASLLFLSVTAAIKDLMRFNSKIAGDVITYYSFWITRNVLLWLKRVDIQILVCF